MNSNITREAVAKCPAQPVNMKSFVAFMFQAMTDTYDGRIDSKQSLAIAALASQVNKALENEIKRTLVQCRMKELGVDIKPEIRNIESKKFE